MGLPALIFSSTCGNSTAAGQTNKHGLPAPGHCLTSLHIALFPWQVIILSAHGSVHMANCCCISLSTALSPLDFNVSSLCSWLCAHGRTSAYLSAHGSECCVSLLMALWRSLCPWQVIVVSRCPLLYAMTGVYCNFLLKALSPRHVNVSSLCSQLVARGRALAYLFAHGSMSMLGKCCISLPIAGECCVSLLMVVCPWQVLIVSVYSWLCAHGKSLFYLAAHGSVHMAGYCCILSAHL